MPAPPRPATYDRRGVFNDALEAREAGPEASEPLVTEVGALTTFPAPPRPVVMYCCCGVTDGCGSTIEYLEDMMPEFGGCIAVPELEKAIEIQDYFLR